MRDEDVPLFLCGSGSFPDGRIRAADLSNPQSLNGYAYGWNNPLTLTDMSGLCPDERIDICEVTVSSNGQVWYVTGGAGGAGGGQMEIVRDSDLPGNIGTGGGGPSLWNRILNSSVVNLLGNISNWLPGACSGGVFAFGGANVGKEDQKGGGQFALVSADYSPDKGVTTEGSSLTEGFAASGRGGGVVLPQGEVIAFVPVAHGNVGGGKLEGGAFFGANFSNVPISIGVYGEAEAGKRGLVNAAAGGGGYLNFTNASTCVQMYLAGRK